jgi:hypothetical protein
MIKKIKKTTNVGDDEMAGVRWEKGTLMHCRWECKLVQPLGKLLWRFLKKLKLEFPCDLAIPFLGICPEDSKSPYYRDICMPMFITALFTIAKLWKKA